MEGQASVALAPTIAGWLEPRTSMMSSFNKPSSEPQLTVKIKINNNINLHLSLDHVMISF